MTATPPPEEIKALSAAAQAGDCAFIIRFTTAYGYDHVDDSSDHRTPLLMAIKAGQIDTAKLLIDLGASLHHTSPFGEEPFCEAVKHGLFELVEYMLENGEQPDNRIYDRLNNPLILAIAHGGQIKMAELLLDNGMPTDGRDIEGNTALIVAAEMRREDIVSLLLNRGADFMMVNDNGRSALDIAMDEEDARIVQRLIAADRAKPKSKAEETARTQTEEEARKKLSEDLRESLRERLKQRKPPRL